MDVATQQVFLEKIIEFLLLDRGHGVDLCTEGLRSQCEFNSMIPLLSLWQFTKGFFQKHVLKAVVRFQNHLLECGMGHITFGRFHKLCRHGGCCMYPFQRVCCCFDRSFIIQTITSALCLSAVIWAVCQFNFACVPVDVEIVFCKPGMP